MTKKDLKSEHPLKLGRGIGAFRIILFLLVVVLISFGFVESADAAPQIEFVDPTPSNDSVNFSILWVSTPQMEINVSITEPDLKEMKFNWDGTNYSFYDDNLVLMFNFDNVSVLGEGNTKAVDISKYRNNGTITNAVWNSSGKYGGAFKFNGATTYIQIPHNSMLAPWGDGTQDAELTACAWIKPDSRGEGVWFGQAVTGFYFGLNLAGRMRSIFYNGTSWTEKYYYFDDKGPIQIDGKWHHNCWVVIYKTDGGGNLSAYLDGNYIASVTKSANKMADSGSVFRIGTLYTGSYFNGSIDEIRIWNRSLSADEIKQLYYSNLRKYDTDKWNLYVNYTSSVDKFLSTKTFFAVASNSSRNENSTEKRTTTYLSLNTTEYYDNRKATAVFTFDDWSNGFHAKFMDMCDAAQKYKIVASVGIITNGCNSTTWQGIQQQIDEGFVSPVSHSYTHTYPCTDLTKNCTWGVNWKDNPNFPGNELEVCQSRTDIINNLNLPWQNTFNGSEYMVGWLQPGGVSYPAQRANLSACNYLADRSTGTGVSNTWASWNDTDGLFNMMAVTSAENANTAFFDTQYNNGGIYLFYAHPSIYNWTEGQPNAPFLGLFEYVGNRTDVWYPGWGEMYMYRYLSHIERPTINVSSYSTQAIELNLSANGTARNRYGLSYPVTYEFVIPSDWLYAFVFYKNSSDEDYILMTEKTRNEFWNGIDTYRNNLNGNKVYVSKSFPQTSNNLYLKIIPIPLSDFDGTDLYRVNISNITNLVLEKSNYGKINFSESVDLSSGGNLNAYVNISHNYIAINSTSLPELNNSATLILYNLTFANPIVLRDGAVCPSSICTKLSYSAGTLRFNVTSFTSYSAAEDTAPSITLESPVDDSFSTGNISFNCSASDDYGLANLTLYWNYSGAFVANETAGVSGVGNATTFIRTDLTDRMIVWNCYACDIGGNCQFASANRTITIDATKPTINLITPANNTGDSDGSITFSYNVIDNSSITSCSLVINYVLNQTDTAIAMDAIQNFTLNLSVGSYNWSINCTDGANNVGSSMIRMLAVVKATDLVGDTTDLSQVDISDITNLVLEEPDHGKINFSEAVDLSSGADLNAYVNISHNWIEINSSALPALNKSATLYLYNLSFSNPRILRDGSVCPSTMCRKVSYSGGALIFNVTGFTVYSAEESPVEQQQAVGSCYKGMQLIALPKINLTQGESLQINLTVRNIGYCDLYSINISLDVPAGWRTTSEVISSLYRGQNQTIALQIKPSEYALGNYTLTAKADSIGEHETQPISILIVKKPEPALRIPQEGIGQAPQQEFGNVTVVAENATDEAKTAASEGPSGYKTREIEWFYYALVLVLFAAFISIWWKKGFIDNLANQLRLRKSLKKLKSRSSRAQACLSMSVMGGWDLV
jgi:hypothetical protein